MKVQIENPHRFWPDKHAGDYPWSRLDVSTPGRVFLTSSPVKEGAG